MLTSQPIEISANVDRSGSGLWEARLFETRDCETIIHELSHLLGFPDEYDECHSDITAEDLRGEFPVETFACRVPPRGMTIMGSNGRFYSDIIAGRSQTNLYSRDQVRHILYPGCRVGDQNHNNQAAYSCWDRAYVRDANCRLEQTPIHCGRPWGRINPRPFPEGSHR